MTKTPDVISREMLGKLAVTAPGFSCELGTPERKMLDAVAESISEAYVDQYLVGSLLDIEAKSGIELEQWVGIFGFGRLQGRKATGVVRIEMTNANTQDISVNIGTQFFTRQGLPGVASPLFFASTQAAVIPAGTFVADIPVECTVIGTSGNLPPDSIVYLGEIIGASSVTNLTAMTGGVDAETDAELRQRFKDTFMRNVAGTEDWYLGLCYQNKNVSKAVCVGPIRKYATQINVPSPTMTLPVSGDVKYAWPDGETVFKNLGQIDEVFYRPIDDYVFTSGGSPQITRVGTGAMVEGDVVDVEFEYTTRSSRNDPLNGIINKVDVFANGTAPYSITERTVVSRPDAVHQHRRPAVDRQLRARGHAGQPQRRQPVHAAGQRAGPELPVLDSPWASPTSSRACTTTCCAAPRCWPGRSGRWPESSGCPTGPATDTPLTLTYVYNRVPEVLNAVLKKNKQLTTDVLVHQASYAYLKIYLSVEYDRGYRGQSDRQLHPGPDALLLRRAALSAPGSRSAT